MSIQLPSIAALAATLALIPVSACNLDVPDLNNPGIDDLAQNPTRSSVTAACTGLLIGNRRNRAAGNGYIAQLGILGREAYNFDGADPRYFGELLEGTLQQGSPFGGNFWGAPYANIRLANTVQRAVDKVAEFSGEEKSAILGFSQTIEATDLLEVAVTHDTNGGVIDTDHDLDQALGPIVGKAEMFAEIVKQLDDSAAALGKAGKEFPFPLSSGYKGFDTPATFLKYNRAIRARVAVYVKDYAGALTALQASFLDDTVMTVAGLQVGVSHAYSTGSGDATNSLINPNLFAHPSFRMDAQMNGANPDARFTRKTRTVTTSGSGGGVSSNLKYTVYASNTAPVPIIRNEELLLLRAEARYVTGDTAGALADLNLVRTVSGGLAAIAGPLTMTDFVTALLYERRYSLAFEGHRWIDARRLDRIMDLPLDKPAHNRNVRYPIPLAECNARPGEPACMLGSLPSP
ncbi:MAG TPA: RagB/SusD family nutrient uptake outer membrane protein [Kofleriaceae bacterium]|nr:RagB/SusD family nutrient uptake outer membrane protein [Kofleriaceae bacterium]